MSRNALSCVRCDKALVNVDSASENQPENGLAFISYGHYGTTAFDPMNGSYLEINLCDECLVALGVEGRVLWGRDRAPAVVDGVVVGTVQLKHAYALVLWRPELGSHPQAGTLGWGGITPIERDEHAAGDPEAV